MSIIPIVFIALGLSMDAFAVSVTRGLAVKTSRAANAIKVAAFFGGFQAIMPVLGWLAGTRVRDLISGIDHWIAFGLLAAIGGKMIYESFKVDAGGKKNGSLTIPVLFVLAVATSIDAFAVGLSLSFLDISIMAPALIIGAITFFLSFIAFFIGSALGGFFEKRIEAVGGLILIGIGIKIVLDHLV
ncbi:MAG: manganese efflux pump MntP family protein [Dehalococcoidia bacterium]|nr:manganese efflux pump MntP family protein [Dehalococcoidia bacterium]MDZ4246071.1 manganese efflux pump MntP family protein [Dehalococcoidia bacterium]